MHAVAKVEPGSTSAMSRCDSLRQPATGVSPVAKLVATHVAAIFHSINRALLCCVCVEIDVHSLVTHPVSIKVCVRACVRAWVCVCDSNTKCCYHTSLGTAHVGTRHIPSKYLSRARL